MVITIFLETFPITNLYFEGLHVTQLGDLFKDFFSGSTITDRKPIKPNPNVGSQLVSSQFVCGQLTWFVFSDAAKQIQN